MKVSIPKITEFESLASYIEAVLSAKKIRRPSYSYTLLAKELGVRSRQLLIMIANQRRIPTGQILEKLAIAMDWNEEELIYGTLLLQLERCQTDLERRSLEKAIKLIQHNPTDG